MTLTQTRPASPWHAGEIAMQRSIGLAERMEKLGPQVIRDRLIEQHRDFYPHLPFVVLGAVDEAGDVWATLRAGEPGFLDAPDAFHLAVTTEPEPTDPAEAGLADGAAIALLGIELTTRRRNRLNGTIRRADPQRFLIEVEQSFGNCPKYIQRRPAAFSRDPRVAAIAAPLVSMELDEQARALVASADTFFVATFVDGDGHRQVDVSHRGGRPGFVRVSADGTLTIPDFSGNRFFNTLGNIVANPRAGLVFVDFATGDVLQMTGDARVVPDAPDLAGFEGAERLWRFSPRRVVFRAGALALRFSVSPEGWSPYALATGTWAEADERRAQDAGGVM